MSWTFIADTRVNTSIVGNISTIILAEVLHILIDLLEFPDSESFIKQTFFVDSAANNSDRSKSATSFETFYRKIKIPTEYSYIKLDHRIQIESTNYIVTQNKIYQKIFWTKKG